MHYIDLTHTLSENMPLYPGTEKPTIDHLGDTNEKGFRISWLHIQSHMGTHMDAPEHYYRNGYTLDALDVNFFTGRAYVLDVPEYEMAITKDQLKSHSAFLAQADICIIRTGFSKYFYEEKYFGKFPVLTEEAAEYLTEFSLKGIALDVCSVDPVVTSSYPIHEILLKNKFFIIENLANVEKIRSTFVDFIALPLKFSNSDGAPVRVIVKEIL